MRFLPSVLLSGLLVLTSAALPVESATHRQAGALVADILHGQSERVSFDFPGTVTYICTNQAVSALNPDIALELGISTESVKHYIDLLCDKIGAANRTEAVAIALRKHLLKS